MGTTQVTKGKVMGLVLLVLLIALLFGGLGCPANVFWLVAGFVFLLLVLGFVASSADTRWYRW